MYTLTFLHIYLSSISEKQTKKPQNLPDMLGLVAAPALNFKGRKQLVASGVFRLQAVASAGR